MADDRQSLDARVMRLEEELEQLQLKVEELSTRLAVGTTYKAKMERVEVPGEAEDASEEILSWVGQASLLPRISTLCFLLVVALALRTVTDNELLDKQVGSLLGMVYACTLISWGAFKYRQKSPLAPVFALCGTFLIFSVVVETHAHFEALPSIPAYILLALVGAGTAAVSYYNRVALPVFAGTLGMSVAAVAIDYPNPTFPYLLLVLLAANLFGVFATRLQRCSWLRWILLSITLLVLQVWGFKLAVFLGKHGVENVPYAMVGFLPIVMVFCAVYLGTAIMGIIWRGQDPIAKFDLALPTLSTGVIFILVRFLANTGLVSPTAIGASGVLGALGLFGLAHWLGCRKGEQAVGTNAFSLAASVLLVLALPLAIGQPLVALTLVSGCALAMAWIAEKWQSGGVRVTSYLLQIYASGALILELHATEATAPSAVSALAAGALACLGLLHYRWVRGHAPPKASLFFSRFDNEDRCAVLLLFAALIGGFFTLRVGVYQTLQTLGVNSVGAFGCYQSVLINLSAIILMIMGFLRNNKELRNVAILVTLVGGAKVFFGDLLGGKGLPLVISVFSFGLAAALESIILGRWPKTNGTSGSVAEPAPNPTNE